MGEIVLPNNYKLQEIKSNPIDEAELENLHRLSGSYEALFNKRASLYKELKLGNKNLTEQDFKKYLLEHYTFLKRPVLINEEEIFIGNSKKTVEAAKQSVRS